MSDEEIIEKALAEAPKEEVVTEEVTEESGDPLEAIAREGGWAPLEEWRGDEEKWKDAETFIREGIKIQGKQHDKIDRLVQTVTKVESNLKEMAKGEAQRTRKALEAQKERLLKERQEAFDDQDATRFEQIDSELKQTDDSLRDIESPKQDFLKGEEEFIKKNEWYGKDKAMTAYAATAAQSLIGTFPDIDATEYYETLEKVVRANFPNEFRNTNRDAGGMASADRPASKSGSSKKSFDSLPPEAKEAYEEIKMFSPLSKADYVKSYFEEIAE